MPAPPLSIQSSETARWKTPGYVGLAASVLLLLGWALIQFTREPGCRAGSTSARAEVLCTFSGEGGCSRGKVPSLGGVAAGADGVGPRFDTTHPEGLAAVLPPERGTRLKEKPKPSSEPARKVRPGKPARRGSRLRWPKGEFSMQAGASRRNERPIAKRKALSDDRVETEFLPFMAAGPQFPSEQRQFVRVKLPRSALQVFGLPMNMERAREPVQADVMLGEDGRALAVRFVRD